MKNFSLFLILFSITSAHADTYDDTTCDNVCSQIVNTTDAKALGITGADSWTSSDDAWCAANPYSSSTPPSTTTLASQDNRCQYHNTQVLTYCIAYEKTQAAKGMEMPLLMLDVAGAAICGVACAETVAPTGIYAACRIDSTAASAMDIYDAMVLESDPTARALTGVMGAAGIASNLSSLKDIQGSQGNIKDFFKGATGDHDKRNACITAGILAAGAGMRAWDMSHQQQSKQSACTDVKNLLSNSPVIGVLNTTTTPVAQAGSSSNVSISGVNSQNRTAGAITGSGAGGIQAQLSCAQNGLTSCNYGNQGQASAATDGGLLSSSGLDKSAAQQLAKSDLSGLSSTPDASSLISSALGSTAGDVGTKIAEVAKAAQQDGQKLAKASGSYSGGGSAVAEAPQAPGFGNFNFDSGPAGEKKEEVKFDRAPASASGDIWHADFKGSIFQIVSSKIVETKPRVDNLDWTTPLNRALMGLPQQKSAGGQK
jgi:hypothetical protein